MQMIWLGYHKTGIKEYSAVIIARNNGVIIPNLSYYDFVVRSEDVGDGMSEYWIEYDIKKILTDFEDYKHPNQMLNDIQETLGIKRLHKNKHYKNQVYDKRGRPLIEK